MHPIEEHRRRAEFLTDALRSRGASQTEIPDVVIPAMASWAVDPEAPFVWWKTLHAEEGFVIFLLAGQLQIFRWSESLTGLLEVGIVPLEEIQHVEVYPSTSWHRYYLEKGDDPEQAPFSGPFDQAAVTFNGDITPFGNVLEFPLPGREQHPDDLRFVRALIARLAESPEARRSD